MGDSTVNNASAVADALDLLGAAWRGDWSDFDGRTLRNQLGELSAALTGDVPFDARQWAAANGICPERRSWAEHCDQRSHGRPYGDCDHIQAVVS